LHKKISNQNYALVSTQKKKKRKKKKKRREDEKGPLVETHPRRTLLLPQSTRKSNHKHIKTVLKIKENKELHFTV
jgi:hypothetical protein